MDIRSAIAVFMTFGIVFLLFWLQRRRAQVQEKLLHDQAEKLHGRVKGKGFWSFPKLKFSHSGYEITIFSTPGGSRYPPHTYVRSSLKFPRDVKLTLYSEEQLFSKIFEVLGMEDLQTGNRKFDSAFIIRGDESFVQNFLIPFIQNKLLSLKDQFVSLRITQHKFVLNVKYIPKDSSEYDAFIRVVRQCFEHLKSLE